jgi:putative ubiquitin-RnfH superfamily antitoxin RatB of RatAB toxin-antitoxin module
MRDGLTALGAVQASGLLEECPELTERPLLLGIYGERVDGARLLRDLVELRHDDLVLGVYGQRVAPGRLLQAGDRVEIYRPLRFDPRDARRKAAQAARPGRRPRNKPPQD